VTEIQYSDSSIASFSYDEQGRMLEARHREIIVTYAYDTEGRVIQEKQGDHIIKYDYDKLGNLTGLTYPSGDKVEFAYDPDTRLAFVKDWQQRLHRFIYADCDEGSRQFHPNGLVTTIYQSKSGLPIHIETKNESTGSELFSFHYHYDDEDRVQTFKDSAFEHRHYEYDAESQLLAVKSDQPQRVETYTYDDAGNRVRFNNESVRCNTVNQLTQQGNIRCDYDAQGNMTTIALPGKQWKYIFNQQNQLIRAESTQGTVVTFGYDAFGRRVWKRSGVRETHYMWMGNSLLSEVTYQAGQPVSYQDYLYLPDNNRFSDKYFRTQALINQQEITYSGFEGLFEEYTSEVIRSKNQVGLQFDSSQRFSALSLYVPLATRINGEIYYYHTDHLGTPRRLTDAQGKIVWAADYSAFGYAFVSIEEIANHLRLPGQYFDAETGLHYNRFRYYLPILGRYISRDPMRYLGGSNFYLYARNNPINIIDPLGLFPWLIVGAVVAAVVVIAAVGCLISEDFCVVCMLGGCKGKGGKARRRKRSLVGEAEAEKIFRKMAKREDIAFAYPTDGCYARAHLMIREMQEMGLKPKKVWTFSSDPSIDPLWVSTSNHPNGMVEWGYHVAPTIQVQGSDGVVQDMVIDPSMFDQPVTVTEWVEAQHDTPRVITTVPGEAPIPSAGGSGYWPSADPLEGPDIHAEETMEEYKRLEGTGN